MKVQITIPLLGIDAAEGTWDGLHLKITSGTPSMTKEEIIERAEFIASTTGSLIMELVPSSGPCSCGRGSVFFPPMCDRCWTEYGDANIQHTDMEARGELDAIHWDQATASQSALLALPPSQEPPKADETVGKFDPTMLDGWSWDTFKAEDGDKGDGQTDQGDGA